MSNDWNIEFEGDKSFSEMVFAEAAAEESGKSRNSSPKTSQRIRYEAEVAVIQKRHGGLEEIRNSLGLSQRKICELLLVDASAWTRWTKEGEKAPPHVYRALAWYLERGSQNETAAVGAPQLDAMRTEWNVHLQNLKTFMLAELALVQDSRSQESWQAEKAELIEKMNKSEKITMGWKLFLLINSAILFYLILKQFL